MARKKTTRKNLRSTPAFDEPWSRNEAILQNILGANNVLVDPQSRIEAILQAILYGTAYTDDPQSRMEELLLCILNGESTDMEPISRNEAILIAKINGDSYTEEPQSRIEALLIEWLNAYIEKTVTGNPITVNDAVAQNVMALLAELEPIQDLHGYDNPWPAGGGENKFNSESWEYPSSRRFWGTNSSNMVSALNALPTGTYTIVATIKVDALDANAENRTYGFLCQGVSVDGRSTREKPSIGTIITVTKTFTLTSAQVGTFTNCYWYASNSSATGDLCTIYDIGINEGTVTSYSPYSNICPITGRDSVSVERTDGDGNNPLSVTVQLGQTVYGGTVDIISGELTISKVCVPISTVQNISQSDSGYFWYSTTGALGIPPISGLNASLMSDRLVKEPNVTASSFEGRITFYANGIIRWKEQEGMTLADYRTYLANNPFHICYELATPITVTLTPQTLAMLAGTNIIQSAEAADLSLTYKATN